jgi:hypothetical protein
MLGVRGASGLPTGRYQVCGELPSESACGFVREGIKEEGVRRRLLTINKQSCEPPLEEWEVNLIADHAFGYPSGGFNAIPHALTDSAAWASLSPAACVIVLAFYRRYDGFKNGKLSVLCADVVGQHGMGNSGSFYAHPQRAVAAGILIRTQENRRTQNGTKPIQIGGQTQATSIAFS